MSRLKSRCLYTPILYTPDVFSSFYYHYGQVVEGCFSHTLAQSYKEDIANFREQYRKLQEFCTDIGSKLTVNWKAHIIACHLEPFLDKTGVGMARYAEQTSESAHAAIKPTEKRFAVADTNPKYPKALKKIASAYSGMNI